ncbi:DUF6320 domain-containing protein [Lachnospiraceae bacterium C1.1]|nr:DUF6320 domain-containing protein [Lachnospiraceae bacterium C1.1]
MQICPKCKIKIRGNKKCCPLCQGKINNSEGAENPAFPTLESKKISDISFLKICTFIAVTLEIVFISINVMTNGVFSFIGPVILGILAGWLTILTTVYLRNNILKVITWEVILAIIIDVYVDMNTGFYGWSFNWMIPMTLIALAIATIIIATVLKLRLDEYIFYLILDVFMSLLQIIFINNGMNDFPWPAAISIMIFLILFAAVLIFRFRDLKNAYGKMFNM